MTHDEAHATFEYVKGYLLWKIKPSPCIGIGSEAGYICRDVKTISYRGKRYSAKNLVWIMFKGPLPKRIHHLNNNKLDCRIENLYEKKPYVSYKRECANL